MNSTNALNRLLALHSRSLACYLASARPFSPIGSDGRAAEVLQIMIADHQRTVDQIAGLLREEGGEIRMSEFPMEFTDLHDLDIDYLIRVLTVEQRANLSVIEQISETLTGDMRAKAVAQEALGAAKGHLDSLTELTSIGAV